MATQLAGSEDGVPQALDDRPDSSKRSEVGEVGTVVIVGNGMVSHRLCERLLGEAGEAGEAAGAPHIVVLGEENRPAYDRVRLGEMLGGRRASSLSLASPEWYHQR